jgi:hypothetical protein
MGIPARKSFKGNGRMFVSVPAKKIRMVSGRFEEDLQASDAYQKTRDGSQQFEYPELPEAGS